MAHERKCIVDLKEYKYCNHCNEYNPDETWRFIFCSQNCRSVYNIVGKFLTSKISADDAKAELDKCDLSGLDHFEDNIKKDIYNIFVSATPEAITEEAKPDTEIIYTETVPSADVIEEEKPVAKISKRKRSVSKEETKISE